MEIPETENASPVAENQAQFQVVTGGILKFTRGMQCKFEILITVEFERTQLQQPRQKRIV